MMIVGVVHAPGIVLAAVRAVVQETVHIVAMVAALLVVAAIVLAVCLDKINHGESVYMGGLARFDLERENETIKQ